MGLKVFRTKGTTDDLARNLPHSLTHSLTHSLFLILLVKRAIPFLNRFLFGKVYTKPKLIVSIFIKPVNNLTGPLAP